MVSVISPDELRESVRVRYAEAARRAEQSGSTCCGPANANTITSDLYDLEQAAAVPAGALAASLGCGNPTALADLLPGESVLDLGSGGGIDVLLSAKQVGPTGFAYGLDMTDEMLALAERNKAAAGVENVRFLKGEIEAIPLPDEAVDVVISNCVINLSADKGQVLREAFRVLTPGGRFAVSDIVVQGELSPEVRTNLDAWAGCVAGALEEEEYRRLLTEVGFAEIGIEVTRVHDPGELVETTGDADCCGGSSCCGVPAGAGDARVVSAFVRARKPAPSR
ncbi:MAG: arsenite methyltransferase [Thermomicrobiales bacterium]